jgi:hypothetical protein
MKGILEAYPVKQANLCTVESKGAKTFFAINFNFERKNQLKMESTVKHQTRFGVSVLQQLSLCQSGGDRVHEKRWNISRGFWQFAVGRSFSGLIKTQAC